MAKDVAFPVRALREQVTALEAAVTLVLTDTKPRYVHRLRTSVRRVEAQLELLSLMEGVPQHGPEEKEVRRRLRKLRQAAGAVRDSDVQIEMVEAQGTETDGGKIHREAKRLVRRLKEERHREKDGLLRVVKRQGEKMVPQIERLLEVLEPAGETEVSGRAMRSLIERLVAERMKAGGDEKGRDNEARLHGLRKAAKLARYVAETAGGSTGMRSLGRRYEALQESGGAWHDWLVLERMARRHLGGDALLTERFERECASSLKRYEVALSRSGLGKGLADGSVADAG